MEGDVPATTDVPVHYQMASPPAVDLVFLFKWLSFGTQIDQFLLCANSLPRYFLHLGPMFICVYF